MNTALTLLLLLTIPGAEAVTPTPAFPGERQWAALSATVRIVNPALKLDGNGVSLDFTDGSGVILGRRGRDTYVLTARHLVTGADRLLVATFARKSYPRPQSLHNGVRVVAEDAGSDLAVVCFTTADAPPGTMSVCPLDQVPAGKAVSVLTVGCNTRGALSCRTATLGEKKRIRRKGAKETCLAWQQAEAPEKGRSGGPLLDAKGRLLGICSGRSDGKGYYTHVTEIRQFLEKKDLGFLLGSQRKPGR